MSQDLLDFDQLNAALSNKMALPRSASKTKYQCSKSNLYPFLVILTNQIKLQVLWIILRTLVNLFSHQSLILEPSWVINLVTHLHRQFSVDLVVEFTVYFLPWTPICNKRKMSKTQINISKHLNFYSYSHNIYVRFTPAMLESEHEFWFYIVLCCSEQQANLHTVLVLADMFFLWLIQLSWRSSVWSNKL